jgi:hypothetical protein
MCVPIKHHCVCVCVCVCIKKKLLLRLMLFLFSTYDITLALLNNCVCSTINKRLGNVCTDFCAMNTFPTCSFSLKRSKIKMRALN